MTEAMKMFPLKATSARCSLARVLLCLTTSPTSPDRDGPVREGRLIGGRCPKHLRGSTAAGWPGLLNTPVPGVSPRRRFSYQHIDCRQCNWKQSLTCENLTSSVHLEVLQQERVSACALSVCKRGRDEHLPPPGSGACICGTLSSTWCCHREAAAVSVAPAVCAAAGPVLTSFLDALLLLFC